MLYTLSKYYDLKKYIPWSLALLLCTSLYAEPLSSTIGAKSINDSIFTLEGNGGIDVTAYDLDIHWDNKTEHIKGEVQL